MSITIQFEPWRQFQARKKREEIRRWLQGIGDKGTEAFRSGMGKYPPASPSGAWPHSRSGRLRASIRSEVTDKSVTIGTNRPYSIFLRRGTRKMARRKMSDDALKEGMRASRLGRWVEWSRL